MIINTGFQLLFVLFSGLSAAVFKYVMQIITCRNIRINNEKGAGKYPIFHKRKKQGDIGSFFGRFCTWVGEYLNDMSNNL